MTSAILKPYRLHLSCRIQYQDYKCCLKVAQFKTIRWYHCLQVKYDTYNPFAKSNDQCKTVMNEDCSQRLFCQSSSRKTSRSLKDDDINLDFEDHKSAFKDRSSVELLRSLAILRLCGIESFSRNSLKVSLVEY